MNPPFQLQHVDGVARSNRGVVKIYGTKLNVQSRLRVGTKLRTKLKSAVRAKPRRAPWPRNPSQASRSQSLHLRALASYSHQTHTYVKMARFRAPVAEISHRCLGRSGGSMSMRRPSSPPTNRMLRTVGSTHSEAWTADPASAGSGIEAPVLVSWVPGEEPTPGLGTQACSAFRFGHLP